MLLSYLFVYSLHAHDVFTPFFYTFIFSACPLGGFSGVHMKRLSCFLSFHRSSESLLIKRAPPSNHPGEGAITPQSLCAEEPSGRRREKFPRNLLIGPTRSFLLQVAAIAVFFAVRQRRSNLSDTKQYPRRSPWTIEN